MTGPWDNEGGRREERRPSFWRGYFQVVTFWRVFAVLVFITVVGAMQGAPQPPKGPHVARLWVTGVIASDPFREELLADLAGDEDVKAVLLRIDSPGGTIAGSEILYENLRKLAAKKPVIAVLGEVAASGGYIAALGADRIVARGNTTTASIGVVMQYPKVNGLLASLGVEMKEMKSSPLKAEPSPFGDTPEAALDIHRALIEDGYQWFRGLVAERRGLEGAALDAVADGRVMSGRQALAAGLIDALGGEDEAAAWLLAEHGIDAPLMEAAVEEEEQDRLLQLLFGFAGLETPESLLSQKALPDPARRALLGRRLMAIAD